MSHHIRRDYDDIDWAPIEGGRRSSGRRRSWEDEWEEEFEEELRAQHRTPRTKSERKKQSEPHGERSASGRKEPGRSVSANRKRTNSAAIRQNQRTRTAAETSAYRDDRRKNGRRRKKKRRTGAIIFFVIVMLLAFALLGLLYVQGTLNKIGRVNYQSTVAASEETFDRDAEGADTLAASEVDFDTDSIAMMQDDDVKNILLIGQDKRHGDEQRQRSDTMIICSINCASRKIVLTSLMRDMYVEIPGYSANRINAAYQLGGMELLDEVIRTNFGITIDGNVEVDFDGFLDALTLVGNLDIELTQQEADYLNANPGLGTTDDTRSAEMESWDLHEGMNSLTPDQALAYARARHVGNSDYERTERQRKVIMAAFDKAMSSDMIKILQLVSDILPTMTTDMGNQEILSYVKTVVADNIRTVESYRVPTNDGFSSETINGMSVLLPDLQLESAYMQYYIYGVESEILSDEYKISGWDEKANTEVDEATG